MEKKPKRIAKYKMIEHDILNKINSGEYVRGQMIETEHELTKKYQVSRVTVRQATNNLVAKGHLVRSQGSGTFVAHPTAVGRTTQVESFTEEMAALGKEVTSEILNFKIITANDLIAEKLQVEIDEPVYFIERLRKADGDVMMFETSYMVVADYPDLSYEKITQSKYKYVEETRKETIDYSHHAIIPIMPTEEIVQHFNCDPESPLLKVMNTTHLVSGSVLDYTILIINVEKYQYQAIRVK